LSYVVVIIGLSVVADAPVVGLSVVAAADVGFSVIGAAVDGGLSVVAAAVGVGPPVGAVGVLGSDVGGVGPISAAQRALQATFGRKFGRMTSGELGTSNKF